MVNDHLVNAVCLPGGKIVVFTGLLEHFRNVEEIATIIGHEVNLFFTAFPMSIMVYPYLAIVLLFDGA